MPLPPASVTTIRPTTFARDGYTILSVISPGGSASPHSSRSWRPIHAPCSRQKSDPTEKEVDGAGGSGGGWHRADTVEHPRPRGGQRSGRTCFFVPSTSRRPASKELLSKLTGKVVS